MLASILEMIIHAVLQELLITLLFKCSALKKKLKERMSEFQVSSNSCFLWLNSSDSCSYLYNCLFNIFSYASFILFGLFVALQILRQKIQEEYREVIERRVFTGLNTFCKNWLTYIFLFYLFMVLTVSCLSWITSDGYQSWWRGIITVHYSQGLHYVLIVFNSADNW